MSTHVERPIQFSSRAKFVTVLSIVVIMLYVTSHTFHVMVPFIWAIITAYIFNPVITFLQRRTGTPRFWWVTILYVIGFGLIFWATSVVVPLITAQWNELFDVLPAWLKEAETYISQHEKLSIFGYKIADFSQIEQQIFTYLNEMAVSVPTNIPSFLFGLIEGFILTLVYLVVTFYLLLQAEDIPNSFYNLVPRPYREEIRQLVRSVDKVLSAYIRGQFLLIFIMSVLSYIALSIFQIKFALIIAIATGVLEIIPIVGPYLAGGIACTVALLQGTTPFGWEPWVLALVLALVYFVLRQMEDQFIIPNLVGHIVNVHPVLVIFAILAGGALAGALGLLIAIPIAAVIKIVLVYLYSKLVDDPGPQTTLQVEEQYLTTATAPASVEPGLTQAAIQAPETDPPLPERS